MFSRNPFQNTPALNGFYGLAPKRSVVPILLGVALLFMLGCGKEDCQAVPKENCIVSFELRPVCGCDGVTYGNPSTAACNNITEYTFGPCY
ncbi:Kazal-type serine protease inhibitor family protein [Maribacter sp. 2307ULW6-5]|uniref:Kazal-type serine protease inhibitor family protein n=1 Tax=Maribacter sp. 2307ULW6-5 TaxID=3386275 RepID=UPI0039BC7A0B